MNNSSKVKIDQEVYDLYDEYVHSNMSRKEFINRLGAFATVSMSAMFLASCMEPNYAKAVQVPATDSKLKNETIVYSSPKGGGEMKGLLSRPATGTAKLPGVIVVHENRGLNPYIEDVARRLGTANFIALAPDALTPLGGYPGNDDAGRELQAKRTSAEMLEDFIAAYNHLKSHPECSGKVGVVGFCFGGAIANQMATKISDLGASVPFYGSAPALELVEKIQAPLLIHFAELDTRINEGWPKYEEALKKHNKPYTAHIYPGVNHGFHNDTTPRYDKAAAELAWKRTLDFFNEKLRIS